MCLCEPIHTTNTNEQEAAIQFDGSAVDNSTSLFSEVCNQMQIDLPWLLEEPRCESELLLRYFSHQVSRVKDMLEYREMLQECIHAHHCHGNDIGIVPMMNYHGGGGSEEGYELDAA